MKKDKYIHLIKEWSDLYYSGRTFYSIDKQYGCQLSTVRYVLTKYGGVKSRGHLHPRNPTKEIGYNRYVVKNPTGCWGWSGYVNNSGYGSVTVNNKVMYAHRISYAINFEDPKGLFVCHKCDNPICSNPEHLFLGDYRDNLHDLLKKGLKKNARLPPSKIIEIKEFLKTTTLKNSAVAEIYRVPRWLIWKIKSGNSWACL